MRTPSPGPCACAACCAASNARARSFHNQAPETFNRLHAQHRGLQEQFARIRRVRPIVRAARERDGFCMLFPRWWPAEGTAWGRKPWADPDRPQSQQDVRPPC